MTFSKGMKVLYNSRNTKPYVGCDGYVKQEKPKLYEGVFLEFTATGELARVEFAHKGRKVTKTVSTSSLVPLNAEESR